MIMSMSNTPPQPETLVDQYVDGLMNDQERADFERLIAENAEIRGAIDQQRAIDEAIARVLPVPSRQRLQRLVATACDRHA